MLNFLKKAVNKVSGAITGAVTGLAAGFVPGKYHYLDNKNPGYGLLYLVTLPFYMLTEMGKGAVEGAKKGLVAGFKYPKTLNDHLKIDKNNNELFAKVREYVDNPPKSSEKLLSELEANDISSIVASRQHQMSAEKKETFNKTFAAYNDYIRNTYCPISQKLVQRIQNPIGIKINGENQVCEAASLLRLVADCSRDHIPVSLNGKVITVNDVIKRDQVIPSHVKGFVDQVRGLLSSMVKMQTTLGVPNQLQSESPECKAEAKAFEDIQTAKNNRKVVKAIRKFEHNERPIKDEIELQPRRFGKR